MISALTNAFTTVAQAFGGAFIPVAVAPTPAFVTKVLNRQCWRADCTEPEATPLGLCKRHLEEARSWR